MTPKRKILFIQDTLAGGGAEKVLVDILNSFNYEKYDVTLLLINKIGIYINQIPRQVQLLWLNNDNSTFWKNILRSPFYNRFTCKIIDEFHIKSIIGAVKYSTIISFIEGLPLYYHYLISNRGMKNISWVHIDLNTLHYTENMFTRGVTEYEAYKSMDNIVFVSQQAQKSFETLFKHKFPSKVIYNLIKKEDIIQKAKEQCPLKKKHKITLCSVGRLAPQKRYDRLIKAIAILVHKFHMDVEAWIIGEGELKTELMILADKLSIKDRISFCGFQSNPYTFINSSDAYLMTSDTEGFPLVIGEALCLGKPIIATDVTGPNEMLADGAGILTSKNEKDIATRIKQIFSNNIELSILKAKAIERSKIFNTHITMQQIYSVID